MGSTLEHVQPHQHAPPERPRLTDLRATLLLADGSEFHGHGIGVAGTASGELVLTTAMTGYREAMTDPSYAGQMLMFTYPLIGTYGVDTGEPQSGRIHARAVIMQSLSSTPGQQDSLRAYLEAQRIPAMYGVDTRSITRQIRENGAMPAALVLYYQDRGFANHELQSALVANDYNTTDFIRDVTIDRPQIYGSGRRCIGLLDCGNKISVINEFIQRNTQIVVLPASTSASEILSLAPDGLIISNGPGNPASAQSVVETVRGLNGRVPLLGICLGHQLIALASGAQTYKLKFGHRGANHPVQDCTNGQAFVTTQNHGFAVDEVSLPEDLEVTYRNLNDGTIEGLRHRRLPVQSVQFHPEGAPGPRDGGHILDQWLEQIA